MARLRSPHASSTCHSGGIWYHADDENCVEVPEGAAVHLRRLGFLDVRGPRTPKAGLPQVVGMTPDVSGQDQEPPKGSSTENQSQQGRGKRVRRG